MKPRNLVFVFADQWRRSAAGPYHDDPVYTPNIDTFSKEAVVCTDTVSSFPLCSPARASLLSGLYPLSTGVFTNCKPGVDVRLDENTVCISDVLHEHGYQTGYIGKWHLDEPEISHDPSPRSGAGGWDAYTPPGKGRHGFDFWHAYNAYDKHLQPHYWEDSPDMIRVNRWSPVHETDKAIEFLSKRDRNRPFALYLSWNPPHSPYDSAPGEYWKPYEDLDYVRKNVDISQLAETMHHTLERYPLDEAGLRRLYQGYFASVTGIDAQFGRLVEYLSAEGLLDDTLVVLTADHGDMLASHGLIMKHVWYEESIGIPFIIGGGGLGKGVCGSVFGSQDVPVTLLSLLGLPVPSSWEGRDLSRDITQQVTDEGSHAFVAAVPGREVFVKAFREAGLNPLEYGWRAVRDRRYTYVASVGYLTEKEPQFLLYDNLEDPYQLAPLSGMAARGSSEGRRLEELLVRWLSQQKDPFAVNLKEAGNV